MSARKTKPGSALLLVVSLMSIALFMIAILWRSSVYVHELGLARQEYEQRYWSGYALMTWAIALCQENFDYFLQYTQHHPQTLTIKKWPPHNFLFTNKSTALLTVTQEGPEQLALQTVIQDVGNGFGFKCLLTRKKDDQEVVFSIGDWSN